MPATVAVPLSYLEAIAELRFPPGADARVQALMDRNTNGTLTHDERNELAGWVEFGERIALSRSHAMRLLGRSPAGPSSPR